MTQDLSYVSDSTSQSREKYFASFGTFAQQINKDVYLFSRLPNGVGVIGVRVHCILAFLIFF